MKFFIKTYGCAHNQADSEFMAGQLVEAGYGFADSISEADIIIINTCTVKDPSEKKLYSELERIDTPVVVAGCVPQADKKNPLLAKYSLLGIKHIDCIVGVVEETLGGNTVHLLKQLKDLRLNLPRVRKNPVIEIIPISNGCLGNCTFCKTKFARGTLVSFRPEEIIRQARIALDEGVKEIWLTSEDTGAYGEDIGTNLPELLKGVLKIDKDFRLRIGMINPEYILKYFDEMLEVMEDKRIFKFLHIPVQSGNDEVLKDMKRPYSVEDFRYIVARLREKFPAITLSSDIICGFPTESEEAFQDTLKLVDEMRFPILNISKFYPRKGTKAADMKLLPTRYSKKRSSALTDLNASFTDDSLVGTTVDVLVDDVGSMGDFRSRTDNYRLVILKEGVVLGERLRVSIVSAKRDYLIGTVLN